MDTRDSRTTFDEAARNISGSFAVDPKLKNDIEIFFGLVSDFSIDESCSTDGLRQIIVAFKNFLAKQNCYNALYSFDVLLAEKGMSDAFRADGTTPNILHEIRNCAAQLSRIYTGFVPAEAYLRHGGIDADMSARLRHDSIEDKATSQLEIYAALEGNLHALIKAGDITDEQHYCKRIEAAIAAENTDLMTRKDVAIDLETGVILKKENGKIKKIERYGGDSNTYFYRLLQRPTALLTKYDDRIENVGTRYGGTGFTIEGNIKYARQTRQIYGLENYDDRATEKWPEFVRAIRAADDMLGVQLTILEGINKYTMNPANNPLIGVPFRFDNFLPNALKPYENTPACFHPVAIAVHGLRKEAKHDRRIHIVIDRLILPPLLTAVEQHGLSPIPDTKIMPYARLYNSTLDA